GRGEVDVIRLPRERRQTEVDRWRRLFVDGAAVVLLRFETETVEDLDLVSPLEIDAAVGATLAARRGTKRQTKLEMQLEVAELLLRRRSRSEQFLLDELTAGPFADVRAVEENERSVRR